MLAMQNAVANDAAPDTLSGVLRELLAQARANVRCDPSAADQCLDRCESLLLQTGIAPHVSDDKPVQCSGGLAPWQAARVERHVDANLTSRLSTAELSALVRLSENHFARAFKSSLGYPPHAYVIQRRIRHAQTLLLTTDTPLSQVALACGLADQAHLSRLFRRLLGATPSAWRRQHRVPRTTS